MKQTECAHHIALGLGSNLGDRLAALRAAKEALRPYVQIMACSSVYEAESSYASDQPPFLNAVVCGLTNLDPMGLLYTVKDIEIALGRLPTFHFGPRVIDIDILFFADRVLRTPELVLPHASMHERSFVLAPLVEIMPGWVHPVLKKSVRELFVALPEGDRRSPVYPL